MGMPLIDAFNIALEAAGLRNISDITLDDDQTSQIDTIINREKRQVQYDGYPFNTTRMTLTVNAENVIDVSGFLRVELPLRLTILDNKVFDPRKNQFHDEDLDDIWVISDRSWDDVPEPFQEWIARRAAARFVSAISGPDDTFNEARLREFQSYSSAHLSDDAQWDPIILKERRIRQLGGSGRISGHYGF